MKFTKTESEKVNLKTRVLDGSMVEKIRTGDPGKRSSNLMPENEAQKAGKIRTHPMTLRGMAPEADPELGLPPYKIITIEVSLEMAMQVVTIGRESVRDGLENKKISKMITRKLREDHPGNWTAIVGLHFGMTTSFAEGNFLHFEIADKTFIVFKTS